MESIKSIKYSPNARDYRQLATPLPFIKDHLRAQEIVARFDSLKGTIVHLGPSEDYVRLQMLLAQTEIKYEFQSARNRILETYLYYINDLQDLSIKSACLARVSAALIEIDPDMKLEQYDELHTSVNNDLNNSVNVLLSDTGDHYQVTRNIIRALARTKYTDAHNIALQLNLEDRRDKALFDLASSSMDMPYERINTSHIKESIDQINNIDLKEEATLKYFALLLKSSDAIDELEKDVLAWINSLIEIDSAHVRCNLYGFVYALLTNINRSKYKGLINRVKELLLSSWEEIERGWEKVDFGFKTTETLSSSIDLAREFFNKTEEYRDTINLNEPIAAGTFCDCLQLTIRAFSGLLNKNLDSSEDLDILEILINRIPSRGERAVIWADIALSFVKYNRLSECLRIVREYVKPLVASIYDTDKNYWSDILIATAPALYFDHKLTALEEISKLPKYLNDKAISTICNFILRKQFSTDPYDYSSKQGYKVTYEEMLDLCELINLLFADYRIYEYIEIIADSITSTYGKGKFTRPQKLDIGDRLDKIIEEKLPDTNNIKHDGYKIISKAQVNRIKQIGGIHSDELVEVAHNIPNLSDKAYVLSILVGSFSNKEKKKRMQLIEEASELIMNIPAAIDRINRLQSLASSALDLDITLSKKYSNLAMKTAIESDDPEAYPIQRKLIDFAYSQLGSDFAASLATLADDDPVRVKAKNNIEKRYRLQELKDEIINQSNSSKEADPTRLKEYPRLSWMLLGSLNSYRISTFHMEEMRDFIIIASQLPLERSYPIHAWVIENAVRRFSETDQARTTLRNIFDAMLSASEIASQMSKCSSIQIKRVKHQAIKSYKERSVIIHSGEREKALQHIINWLENECDEYIIICDPFFCLSDLELLQYIRSSDPSCKVQILTSKKQQDQEGVPTPWEESYRSYWRSRISEQRPPETDIVVVGIESSGDSPIHDRWILTKGGGLRIGTSFKSLGIGKESEISSLTEDEAELREKEVIRYLSRSSREYNGERLLYTLFTL